MERRGSAVLQSQNKLYGFYGSMGEAAEEAWALVDAVLATTGQSRMDFFEQLVRSRLG